MEYFYGGGGNSNPDFTYRFKMREITTAMWNWCEAYPLNGPFDRWHVKHNFEEVLDASGYRIQTPLIQFENKKAAFMFSIAFSEYILEDRTYSFAKE